jgi:transposase
MGKDAKYVVRLSDKERQVLGEMTSAKRVAAAKALRARILLKADADGPGWADPQIAEAFDVGASTVHRLRERFVLDGFEAALARKPHPNPKARRLDGAKEAQLITLACSPAPEGCARWTLALLGEKLVELKVVDSICTETVRQTLKKTNSNRGGNISG